jgi:peptidyl-prolyl cis-trans isomerase D
MATLEKIRNRAGLLISVVIGLALLAFILGDLLTHGDAVLRGDQFEIAEIGGESVPYQAFQREVEELVEINKFSQGASSLDAETRQKIRDQVWQRITREYVMNDEYEELGIAVSAEELWDMVQGENIHPMIRRIFTNPETGRVNTMAIINFLKTYEQDPTGQRRAYWLFLEDQMIRERKFTKFGNLVAKGVHITTPHAEKLAQLNSKRVDFNYVVKRFSSLPDTAIQIEESDLRDYYKKHKKNYKQSASRDIEYIAFDIEPTEKDRQETKEVVSQMKDDFKNTEETEEFVNLNSDIPFDNNYYKKEELSDSIDDFMFSANKGEVYGIYFEDETYKLSKLVDKKYLPDSVKLRHILIQPQRTRQSVQQAQSLADSLTQILKEGQGNFAQLAQQHSDDQSTAAEGGNLGWLTKGQYYESIMDSAMIAEAGSIKLVQAQDGFHIIEVMEKGDLVEKVQVATLGRRLEPSSETYQNVYSQASRFAGQNPNYDAFLKAIEEKGMTKRIANNIQINARQIPGLQNARPLIRGAFNTKEKQIIQSDNNPIFEINDKFIIGYVTEVRKEGFAEFEEVKEDIRINVAEQKKAERIAEEMKGELDNAGSLEEFASQQNIRLQTANGINYSSFQIPGAGSEPEVIATASVIEQEKISEPVKGNNGVYVIQVTNVTEAQQSPEMIKQRELQNLQRIATFEAYNALKEAADIEDKRYKFY